MATSSTKRVIDLRGGDENQEGSSRRRALELSLPAHKWLEKSSVTDAHTSGRSATNLLVYGTSKGWYPDMILSQTHLPECRCLDQNGKEIWIKLKYERLGEFCYRCSMLTYPTNRYLRKRRTDEDIEKPSEESFGPWLRAKEICGKHYPTKKQIREEEATGTDLDTLGGNSEEATHTPGPAGQPNNRKRKATKKTPLSPIQETARRSHTGLMNMVAELVTEMHDA
ncbi:hypothetical protein Tsubulata_019604 [Turnera subulata]|uniref:Zinc knuckle CX2CX4HX4C domain-containing protein n=1 Tax=Turnera subulata TaxID=218843 RepID=A0A9Q0FCD6_9ROSI|nr:hypothetical protein Tsubulata_019604 [Turnera subulata]